MGGSMDWLKAMDWVAQLEYAGFEDWRLPSVNEMSHLFYDELGGTGSYPIVVRSNTNVNLFYNIAPLEYDHLIDFYWSPDNNPNDSGFAITFGFNNGPYSGFWNYDGKGLPYGHAWAVIDGDVAAPQPPTANAGPNVSISSEDQGTTVIQGTASDPDSDPITYRWLEGENELTSFQEVINGEAYLQLKCYTIL